ncbi:MAG: carbon-nitrogen hydrolase family protein [Gammaproteobacteria bacterium]|nr:carbon-nitrogen hydrolase family protein [Gammaproteobacteria bacterium]
MTAKLTVAMAQIQPVWLNQTATIEKINLYLIEAAKNGAQLVAFGEGLLPGYPFWLELTSGAEFNSQPQKEMFAHYVNQAINIEQGDLKMLQATCQQHQIAAYIGCIERTAERGVSLYCSMVYIDQNGRIGSIHRKLMPTYEERLVWSPGDGHGLRVHDLEGFKVGGLNCWENWIPMARQSLYAQGEQFHVAIWPGNLRNTVDITRFIAQEARSFVMSVSALINPYDIDPELPLAATIKQAMQEHVTEQNPWFANGGSCLAGPDGQWIVEPIIEQEGITLATVDLNSVYQERQNFDPAGHYSRPDVLQLKVNRQRQATAIFNDANE